MTLRHWLRKQYIAWRIRHLVPGLWPFGTDDIIEAVSMYDIKAAVRRYHGDKMWKRVKGEHGG